MLREVAYSLLGLVIFALALEWAWALFDAPGEPVRLRSKIPVVGHLLGILKHGTTYYNQVIR